MVKKTLLILGIITSILFYTGCSGEQKTEQVAAKKEQLLIYCGITMVKPMTKLVSEFEKTHNVEIKIIQGGSKDLYNSLKASKVGDMYLPGSASYRKNNLKDGLLGEYVFLGYNRASLVVAKGNPKNIKGELKDLTNPNYGVVLCNPESGSIGRETKKILTKAGLYDEATANTKFLTTDSRNITKAIKDKEADISINWHATTAWEENRDYVDSIKIDEKFAMKKELLLNGLTFTKHPGIVKEFLKFAGGEQGRQIFKDYGF